MGNSALKSHITNAEKTGTFSLQNSSLREILKMFKESGEDRRSTRPTCLDQILNFCDPIETFGLVPEEIQALSGNLRTLDLSVNKLESLPDYICNFKSLKLLKLEKNKLRELPSATGSLAKLETLLLQDNHLSSLPKSFVNLSNLKVLNLSGNRLHSFPLELVQLKKLDVLDLSRNKIAEIPDNLEGLQVSDLALSQNQISKISKSIAKCENLKNLRLEENCLTLDAIPVELLKSSKVGLLSLEGNLFEMKTFADADGYSEYMERYTATKKKLF